MKKSLSLAGLLLAAFALQSCIDKSYDLDSIDRMMGIKTDLTIPASSTDTIYLRNIMELEEDGVVQFVADQNGDSVFAVIQDGSADIGDINIEQINIPAPHLEPIETDLYLRPHNVRELRHAPRKNKTINIGGSTVDIPNIGYMYDINPKAAKLDMQDTKAEGISGDLRTVQLLTVDENTAVMTLELYLSGVYPWLETVYIDTCSLTFPRELAIARCTVDNGEGGTPYLSFDDEEKPYTLKDTLVNQQRLMLTPIGYKLHPNKKLTLTLTLKGINHFDKLAESLRNVVFTPSPQQSLANGEALVRGHFEVGGTFRFESDDCINWDEDDENSLINYLKDPKRVTELNQVITTGTLDAIMPESLGFHGNAEFNRGNSKKDIVIKAVTGDIIHDIGDIAPIMLDDLPDFLNDEDVVLDLANPAILIKTYSNIKASPKTGVTITSNTSSNPINIPSITLSGNNKTDYYWIADSKPAFFPEDYKQSVELPHTGGKISELITKIPKQLDVDVLPISLHCENLDITKQYEVTLDYKVFAPLSFGPKFKLVYSDTEDGMSKDLDDMDDINIDHLVLTAIVETNLPASLELEVIPLDKDKNKIVDLKPISTKINAYDASNPSTKKQSIRLSIEPTNGHTLNDVIAGRNGVKQLDGIKYTASILDPSVGQTMRQDSYIKLSNIHITIKGDITYDANDDKD